MATENIFFGRGILHFLPIVTTTVAIFFFNEVFKRYRQRGEGYHLLWWSIGIFCFGMGTFAESWITLLGWNAVIFKFWYIVGALLGGAPLAQGTVWLLLKPKSARILTWAFVIIVAIATICIIASPIQLALVDPHLPSGKVFRWQWVRLFSPIINIYAVIFLIGGALWSAWCFARASSAIAKDRFIGNLGIAVGSILPGMGGIASRLNHTELLYPAELLGLSLIWVGYFYNVRKRPVGQSVSQHRPIQVDSDIPNADSVL